MSCSFPERHARSVALAVGLLALLVVLTAWLGDDCYFTLRSVDNLLHGHGAVWNVGERVQAYTHPLWMLVLTAAMAEARKLLPGSPNKSALTILEAIQNVDTITQLRSEQRARDGL